MVNKSITALTDFTYGKSGVRVLGTQLEPWFAAVDVLRVLDIHTKNITRVLERLDDDEKMLVNLATGTTEMVVSSDYHLNALNSNEKEDELVVKLTTNSQGRGNPDIWLVSEPGLYKIMLRSRTPKAEAFTRFVTHEVLPQIRKYGSYTPFRREGRGKQSKLYLNGLVPRDGLANAAASLGMRVEDARKKSGEELEKFCLERSNPDWVETNRYKYPYSFSMLNRCVGGFLGLVLLDVPDLEKYVLAPSKNCRRNEWCFAQDFADNLEAFAKKAKLSRYFDGACLEKWKTYVSAEQSGELRDISAVEFTRYNWEFDAAKYKEADWA